MDFGSYAVIDPHKHEFEKEPEWYWLIRPSVSGDELAMAKFWARRAPVTNGEEGETVVLHPHWIEIMHREIATLFAGTNIPKDPKKPVSEGGKPILEENAKIEEIEAILRKMPEAMVEEIWVALGKAVPFWGPRIASPETEEDQAQTESTGKKS
jgi:hypothetical protein